MAVGKNIPRVDGYENVTGRAMFTMDLAPKNCLTARVYHSTISNGVVKEIDTSEAEQVEGVVKIITFQDVPQILYPTPGHPWSVEPSHQDVSDRMLLTGRVRYYGDDIAAVIAEDEVAAARALMAQGQSASAAAKAAAAQSPFGKGEIYRLLCREEEDE